MILLDANLLIYAHHANTPHHQAAAAWLQQVLDGSESIGVPWASIWAFLRVSTNPRLWPRPVEASSAVEAIRNLLSQPGVVLIEPGRRHLQILGETVVRYGVVGPLVSDAVLAALAIEHGAILASTDNDFSRFENLRWINPLR